MGPFTGGLGTLAVKGITGLAHTRAKLGPRSCTSVTSGDIISFVYSLMIGLCNKRSLCDISSGRCGVAMKLLRVMSSIFTTLRVGPHGLVGITSSFASFTRPLLRGSNVPSCSTVLPVEPFCGRNRRKGGPRGRGGPRYDIGGDGGNIPVIIYNVLTLVVLLVPLLLILNMNFMIGEVGCNGCVGRGS